MARPEHTDEVTDRTVTLATFQFDQFATDPELTSAYASFVGAARRNASAEAALEYGSVTVRRPKTEAELEAALKGIQQTWDYRKKAHDRALDQGIEGLKDYEVQSIKSFAKSEGLTDPTNTLDLTVSLGV